jgi:hypothetical protein
MLCAVGVPCSPSSVYWSVAVPWIAYASLPLREKPSPSTGNHKGKDDVNAQGLQTVH